MRPPSPNTKGNAFRSKSNPSINQQFDSALSKNQPLAVRQVVLPPTPRRGVFFSGGYQKKRRGLGKYLKHDAHSHHHRKLGIPLLHRVDSRVGGVFFRFWPQESFLGGLRPPIETSYSYPGRLAISLSFSSPVEQERHDTTSRSLHTAFLKDPFTLDRPIQLFDFKTLS